VEISEVKIRVNDAIRNNKDFIGWGECVIDGILLVNNIKIWHYKKDGKDKIRLDFPHKVENKAGSEDGVDVEVKKKVYYYIKPIKQEGYDIFIKAFAGKIKEDLKAKGLKK